MSNTNLCFHPWRRNKLKITAEKMFWWDKYLRGGEKWNSQIKEHSRFLCYRGQSIILPYSAQVCIERNSSHATSKRGALSWGVIILKTACDETPVLYGIRDPWLYREGELEQRGLSSQGEGWWTGKSSKTMKEWSKSRTTDLGNKFKEFGLFLLSNKQTNIQTHKKLIR